MCRRNAMGPSQQSACLYDSSSLASKIFRLSAGHNIKCKLSAAAWVTANDQLRSPFSGFCVKLHLARSVVNDPHGPLFAVNKTQPPTSSESGCHQLYLSALQPLPKCSISSGCRYTGSCVLLGDVGCSHIHNSIWIVLLLIKRIFRAYISKV